ncbi:MAG: polysaccharide biosynthesis/export family protein [Rhodovibrionaceae bacterium]
MTDTLHSKTISRSPLRTPLRACAAAVAASLLLAGCSGGPEATQPAPELEPAPYQLGAGDEIRVEVFGDDSLSSEQRIDGQGSLSLPLVGGVQAAGLTRAELQERLEEHYAEYRRDAEVTVNVLNYRPFYIVGEVREPGGYAYVEGMTVINAIAMAGGYTYRARKEDFVVQRENEQQVMRAGDLSTVMPGDVITVRERYF